MIKYFKNRQGKREAFNISKPHIKYLKALKEVGALTRNKIALKQFENKFIEEAGSCDVISAAAVNAIVMDMLKEACVDAAIAYDRYCQQKKHYRDLVKEKKARIAAYIKSNNNANATVDDNSNVQTKTVGTLNAEINKKDNIALNRGMMMDKLAELFPDFDHKQYLRDLKNHIIYKHDESTSNSGATMPYCVSISMYPFINNGLKGFGYKAGAPKHLLSYCSTFCNLIFATAAQFAGAVATSEFFVFFDYFARKEFGDEWYKDEKIKKQICQYFQMVVHTINQPAGGRGQQACFWNVSIFDRFYFESMFSGMMYPDFTSPVWDSISELQKLFLVWFRNEKLIVPMSFPVVSYSMLTDGKGTYLDEDTFDFMCDSFSKGDDSFVYNSDSADSLASCCRLKNEIDTKEFNFTNGNIGIQTGSKSVITLNLNRIIQNEVNGNEHLEDVVDRVHKYQIAYNELMWDSYNAGLLPVYEAGYIDLDKQFLTIGINGLHEAAEFLGLEVSDNEKYQKFCDGIGKRISLSNEAANGIYFGHNVKFNCEYVPAESLAVKNYNWDKADGYKVPEDRNLYASYVFIPSKTTDLMTRIRMHGTKYLSSMSGGSACHLNIDKPLDKEQYKQLFSYMSKVGCSYATFNLISSECNDCGYIANEPLEVCPKCGGKHITPYTKIIGYRTPVTSWTEARKIEGFGLGNIKGRYYGK